MGRRASTGTLARSNLDWQEAMEPIQATRERSASGGVTLTLEARDSRSSTRQRDVLLDSVSPYLLNVCIMMVVRASHDLMSPVTRDNLLR